MTLDKAVIDLSKSFVEGQGYVALSRVKTLNGLYLKGFNEMALKVHPEVREIDLELRGLSSDLFQKTQKMKVDEFKQNHKDFLERVGAKKFKVVNREGEKLSTYQITKQLVEAKKSLKEIAEERKLKEETIINHLEKLRSEKVITDQDLLYLRPKSSAFRKTMKEIKEASEKIKDKTKLTPIFKELKGKYTFGEIKFAKLFISSK